MRRKKSISLIMSIMLIISAITPFSIFADENPIITVQSVSETAGATVDVAVSINNNPGVLGATLKFTYDENLTLLSAASGDAFSPLTMTKPGNLSSPCNFVWDGQDLSDGDIKDGNIIILKFKIDENVSSGTKCDIKVSYVSGDIVDKNLEVVSPTLENGYIEVINYLPGDLNSDKRVNSTDIIMLRRHIAGKYEQTINELAGDVNADGRFNSTDIIMIRRYVADGCKTLPNGYNIILYPGKYDPVQCDHDLTAVAYKAPTIEEEGNIAYWHCSKCDKYFDDVTTLNEISIGDTVIPKLTGAYHTISYDISNGDDYIEQQIQIKNPNPEIYYEESGLTLKNMSVPGYRFLGWYDGAGSNSEQIKKIPVNSKDDFELYAHWEKIVYTVQLKSDIFIDTNTLTYTVDTGVALPTPKLSNYIFTGWSDEDGKLYRNTKIPVGATGNMYLTANWTSERNKTWTKKKLDAPIIVEDGENIIFAYEIGQIQNVPLYTIKDFGYISGDGVTRTATERYSFKTDETLMSAFSKTTSNATTESSSWSLSSSWNDVTSVNEQWAKENGKDIGQVDTVAKNSESNWNVSSGRSGSTEVSKISTNNVGWESQVQVSGSDEHSESDGTIHRETDNKSWNIDGKLTYTPKSYSLGIGVGGANIDASTSGGFGFEVGGGYEHKWGTEDETSHTETNTSRRGFELSGKQNASISGTKSATQTASWNSNESYGGSNSISQSASTSVNLSEKISQAYGYGHEYAKGEEQSQQQGLTSTQSYEDGYSSSVTYSKIAETEKEATWTTQSTKPGYHRWIVAGTAHVFGVVGYNMLTKSYYVYTYSVMDDETHEFEDYSYTSAQYNDNENGVIPFEIPYDVADYVSKRTCASDGLKVNIDTGMVTEYTGTDTCVVIPEYFNTGSGDIVKITGIDTNAFRGNTNIEAVELSDFITEIPDYAFEGCTSLIGVTGGNIIKIGEGAFSGCTSAKECGVNSQVTYLGENAFRNVGGVIVNAANADVVLAAVNSGADEIVISLEYIEDDSCPENITINVPEGTRYFELNGKKDTVYKNISVESYADVTAINRVSFECNGKTALKLASNNVILNQVSAQSNGLTAVFLADEARIGLQGSVSFVSDNDIAMLCRQIELYEANDKVVGNLSVVKKALACADVVNSELMTGDITVIENEQFENYLNSRRVTFDINGGSGNYESILVPYMGAYGELPRPSRDYYTFAGWYTDVNGGDEVTETSIMTSFTDVTLYAHWTPNSVSDWRPVSELPPDSEVVGRKWTYSQTYYTTSSSSSLGGWTRYNSTWVWSDYGGWSNWQDSYVSGNDYRQVDTQSVISGYNTKTQWLYSRARSPRGSVAYGWKSGDCTVIEGTGWLDSPLPHQADHSCGPAYGKGFRNKDGVVYSGIYWYNETTQVVTDYNSPIYKTQYRYRDRYQIYTYYYTKTEKGKESTSYPTGDNISDIQEYVQYRTK